MPVLRMEACVLALLAFVAPASAQSSSSQPAPAGTVPQRQSAARVPVRRPREAPCWKQVGILPEMVNERWKIEDNAKGRIGKVCTDSALSPEQRLAKIHEIDGQRDGEIAKLIPPRQLEAFNTCQAQWVKNHPPKPGTKELGPCGGVIPPGTNSESHQHHGGGGSSQ